MRVAALKTFPIATTPDLDAALDIFITSRSIKNLSNETIAWYRRRLKTFIDFLKTRDATVQSFAYHDIIAFVDQLQKTVKPQTVNGFIRAIKAFCSFLYAEGFRDDNPVKRLAPLKTGLYAPRTLNDAQIAALINTIAKDATSFANLRDLTLVCLMLDCGLRVSEAINLRFDDIDLVNGFVRVIGKGNKERVVPLGETVRMLLSRYLTKRMTIQCAGDWVFITSLGTKLTRRQVHKRLATWAKKAGIEGVRVSPHSLRFTFVRKWLQSGGDSIILQRILGHSSAAMTSYYAKLFASDLQDAHKRHSPVDGLAPMLKLPRKRVT